MAAISCCPPLQELNVLASHGRFKKKSDLEANKAFRAMACQVVTPPPRIGHCVPPLKKGSTMEALDGVPAPTTLLSTFGTC